MIVTIIFSDNTLSVIKTSHHAMTKSLKKARSDDDVNAIFGRYPDGYESLDDEDAEHAGTTIDLRNKKGSNHKQHGQSFGERYR